MSKSLSIECDPVDQPAAADPVERCTWCALRIRVRGRTVTRIWDESRGEERSLIYVPAFPIADWIVANWWTLLHEPSPTAELPPPSDAQMPWIKRHCLRAAESGLLLPALYLFNDGRGIRAEWRADLRDALPNMPGEFVDSGFDHLDRSEVEQALEEFVNDVIRRAAGCSDERVAELKANWDAIGKADADERSFCVTTARMGVDPYDLSQVPEATVAFIETTLTDPELPLARDVTESARIDSLVDLWSWVKQQTQAWKLGPISRSPPIQPATVAATPAEHGYELAARVREAAQLDSSIPAPSIEQVAGSISAPLQIRIHNHVPGGRVRSVVGWTPTNDIVMAGPQRATESERFRLARGLYHALFACQRTERLVTDAFTWDQRASRAFAAELLAPRAALRTRVPEGASYSRIEELAGEFTVSAMLIKNQLENASVAILDD